MTSIHHFLINGVRWPWRYTRLRGKAQGWTFMPDPKNPSVKRKILIDDRLSGRARLNTEIHEYLHAANPTQSEEHVSQQGDDLTRILWALGYRRKE
jgi:hypothetical protein